MPHGAKGMRLLMAEAQHSSRNPDKRKRRHVRHVKPAEVVLDDVPVTVAVMKQRAMLLRLVSMACQQKNCHNI
jgi:hypothetical protein